jgi:hypothetical protein
VTIKTFPNQTPWIDGSFPAKLKACATAFNHGMATGNMTEYKQRSYSLRKAIKQAKCHFIDKVESQFNSSNTIRVWQGLQSITDYKKITSPVADIDILLTDKLNNFFAHSEDNTVPHQLDTGVFTDIFNQSLSQSAVPTCFKMATIVPVPKKGYPMGTDKDPFWNPFRKSLVWICNLCLFE